MVWQPLGVYSLRSWLCCLSRVPLESFSGSKVCLRHRDLRDADLKGIPRELQWWAGFGLLTWLRLQDCLGGLWSLFS